MPSSENGNHGNRTKYRSSYRCVNKRSEVDESLFGNPHHVVTRNAMLKAKWTAEKVAGNDDQIIVTRGGRQASSAASSGHHGPETVDVITKDLIRTLIVPRKDPAGRAVVLSGSELSRLRQDSRVLSKRERIEMEEQIKAEKREAEKSAELRRQRLKQYDLQRRESEKLTDLEEEAQERAQHLLQKAMEQRAEQEDEIKHLNELILEAKCHAIRDAQILEKQQVQKELAEEERRLDMMMEVERQNQIRMQEEIDKRRKEDSYLGAAKVVEQIRENEQRKLLDLEAKDQDNTQMQKYLEKLMDEERHKIVKKRVEQVKLREDLNKANEEIIKRKSTWKEQDKLLEMKVIEFQRQKAEREAEFEREQAKIKQEKELEIARLRALQERAKNEQEERDMLRAKRAMEDAEREWRQKELEEQRKKSETEAMLIEARIQQREQKEHFLAVQAARERAEFERVLKAQKELIEREKQAEQEAHHRVRKHADELRDQIMSKQRERVEVRNNFFAEGLKIDEEARQRRLKVEQAKEKKLKELRELGIAEKYLAEVERKVHTTTNRLAA